MIRSRRRRIEPYLSRLFAYALSLTNQSSDAEDLLHESVLKTVTAKRVPRDEAAYRAWLFKILRNTFIDQRRHAGTNSRSLEDEPPIRVGDAWRHDETLINVLTVRAGMSKLTPAHREIIALVDIAGFSYSETAKILKLPAGTVMSRLSRARQALLNVIAAGKVHELPVARARKVK